VKPRLSIVIPVINEADRLDSILQALQPLRTDCELLLVDGGSDDASSIIAAPLVDKVLHSPRGRARQMNGGAARAGADVLLFLHADTRLPDGAVNLILRAIAGGYLWGRFDVEFDNPRAIFKLIALMMNWRSRLTGIATGDQAIFITNQAFQAVGGFPDIALMEDIAISTSLKRLGKPCCLVDKVVTSARRWLQHGIFKTILLMWRLRLAYFFGSDPDDLATHYYRRH
jgi:rSAM/selenodomain-associated transferase 2